MKVFCYIFTEYVDENKIVFFLKYEYKKNKLF